MARARLWIAGGRNDLPFLGLMVGVAVSLMLWAMLAGLAWFIASNV